MNRSSSLMQAAMVLNSLPKQQAAKVLSRLEPRDIATVLDAIKSLDKVSTEQRALIDSRFAEEANRYRTEESDAGGGVVNAQQSLGAALTAPKRPLEQVLEPSNPFGFLTEVTPLVRNRLLEDEHPKNIAIVLSMLPSDMASETMTTLDPVLRVSVLKRLCEIHELHDEDVAQLNFALKRRLKKLLSARQAKTDGVDIAANLLSCADVQTRESLITHMGQSDPDLADKLEQSVLSFEKLETLSNADIKTILRNVDTSSWAPALKNATMSFQVKIYSNMAARPAEILANEIADCGDVDSVVESAARQNIIQVVMRLAREGKIVQDLIGATQPEPQVMSQNATGGGQQLGSQNAA